ncbi:hypothetical protein SCB71_14295 [Herbiconiux sp. KACC 21604]|uniref:hypothetical protein n=1 Tax=unclassified Herbiconiux TaxID=2618217 RepID=UPI001491233F|nr:hypothetical protein [Herbiconiux sp. SALV-R1]QJU54312.1 hypothetical protein HL652_12235 [Herbiconiux sp. SALV-R1]WPO85382.1 hypothetical protein SCB71_14295 [Herbiconiux sp. KACC 21604]
MNSDPHPAGTASLGLATVLTNDLPASLLTPEAPERYTVSAVFTRKPMKEEITGILSADTRDHLTAAGYTTVELKVSDRRLQIENTNLEELADGLATILADRLQTISADAAAERDRMSAALSAATQQETDRAALVALAAATIRFQPSGGLDTGASTYS